MEGSVTQELANDNDQMQRNLKIKGKKYIQEGLLQYLSYTDCGWPYTDKIFKRYDPNYIQLKHVDKHLLC